MAKLPTPMPPPGEMLRRKQMERRRRQRYMALGSGLCLLTAALVLTFTQVILLHRHQGLDMFPTVEDGDLVLADRLRKTYAENDLILYRVDGKVRMGRIAAVAGDQVMMDDSGGLLVNGSIRNGQILFPTYAREDTVYPQRIPEGTVYILGDHRTQSWDSRDHGCIPVEAILGKVILRFGGIS